MSTARPASRTPSRNERVELRLSSEQKSLIAAAATARDQSQSEFMRESLDLAARRALADRTEFALPADAWSAWEAINQRPARDLPGLRALIDRPSPFTDRG